MSNLLSWPELTDKKSRCVTGSLVGGFFLDVMTLLLFSFLKRTFMLFGLFSVPYCVIYYLVYVKGLQSN